MSSWFSPSLSFKIKANLFVCDVPGPAGAVRLRYCPYFHYSRKRNGVGACSFMFGVTMYIS